MCEGPAALDTVLAGAVAEMEQRGSTGSVHLLTLPLEKRCVSPPSARGHNQPVSAEKGDRRSSTRILRIDSAFTYLVLQKGLKLWPLHNRRAVTRPLFVRFV